jgi:uncharacterized protein (DUF1697 family)
MWSYCGRAGSRQNVVMATHVALLRGINLGGRNKVAMADLRRVVASLGHTDVATYIQSGNVLFTTAESDTDKLSEALDQAIAAELGVTSPVVVLSRDELEQVIRDNPYPDEPNPKYVHAVLRRGTPSQDMLDRIAEASDQAARSGSRDSVQSVGRALYLHTPDGYGRSELAQALLRIVSSPKAGMTGTARNWSTVTKLLSLCDSPS